MDVILLFPNITRRSNIKKSVNITLFSEPVLFPLAYSFFVWIKLYCSIISKRGAKTSRAAVDFNQPPDFMHTPLTSLIRVVMFVPHRGG